jgi:L-arabinonolactonase
MDGAPDGSCIDADGHLWNAQWGARRVVCYRPDGTVERVIESPALQPSCIAIGGPGMNVLFVTSARVGIGEPAVHDGALFCCNGAAVRGLPEVRFRR